MVSGLVLREESTEGELEEEKEIEVTGGGGENQAQWELRVYRRRIKVNVLMLIVSLMPSFLSPPSPTPKTPTLFTTNLGDMISLFSSRDIKEDLSQ